jgi:NAD+ diphosphatase
MQRKFCYLCGNKVITKDEFVFVCDSCGQTFYENPKPCVEIALFNESGQILLAKRLAEPFKGKYDLPGGFVDKYESLEHAIIREIKEELGIDEQDLKNFHFVGSYNADYPWGKETFGIVIAEFTATVRNDLGVQAMDDVEEVKWVDVNDLDNYDLSVPGLRPMIDIVLKGRGG